VSCSHTRQSRGADEVWRCRKCGAKIVEDRTHEIVESRQAPTFGFARVGRVERKRVIVTEAEAHDMEQAGERKFQDKLTRATTQRGHRLKDAYYEKQVRAPVGQDIQPIEAPA
jgi:ribosomal protein L37AE/L43A